MEIQILPTAIFILRVMYSKDLYTNIQFLRQIHALSASGTDLNVKLRLAITIGKVLSRVRELSIGKTGPDLGHVLSHVLSHVLGHVLESVAQE